MPAWTRPSIAQVQATTAKTVTTAQIASASATVETLFGVIEATDRPDLSERDAFWLRRITEYQAAWLADRPDAFTRDDVSTVSQDGASATFTASGHVLAPFAARAAKRLSWRGTRSVSIHSPSSASADDADDLLEWKPLS